MCLVSRKYVKIDTPKMAVFVCVEFELRAFVAVVALFFVFPSFIYYIHTI